MGRKPSNGKKIDQIIVTQKNGDRYVYERIRKYNSSTQTYVNEHLELLGKMRPGSLDKNDLLPTRPKRNFKSNIGEKYDRLTATKKHTGMIDIIKHFSELSGIESALREILKNEDGLIEKILTCVWYCFATDGDSWPGIYNWSTKYAGLLPYKAGPITKDIYHRLFSELGMREDIKQLIFLNQSKNIKDGSILAIDTSTFETESENLNVSRKAQHKDGLIKNVYKIQYFYAIEYRKPLAYTLLPGNISDSETVKNALLQLEVLGCKEMELVTDNGYCKEHVIAMYLNKKQYFLTRIEARIKWIKELIEKNRDFLEHSGEIVDCDPKFCGIKTTVERTFKEKNGNSITGRINVFIYFSSVNKAKDDVYFRQMYLNYKDDILQGRVLGTDKKKTESFANEYMVILKNSDDTIQSININKDAYNEHMKYNGYLVLISNKETDLNTALLHFRYREYIEENIKNYKGHIGGRKPRVWYDDTLDGEVLVQFLSLCMHEAYETKINYIKKNLAVPNGDVLHDVPEILQIEKQLSNWLNNNSMNDVLNWFDVIETKNVKDKDGKIVNWKTEIIKRDQLFLEKLGLNDTNSD